MNFAAFISTLAQLLCVANAITGKIINYGTKLPELVELHPDKSWLIKFYAPWCYHCQQIEHVFMNVAEQIYHKHDNLIVGQVDCTKYGPTCEKYGVKSYPEIAYLNKNTHVTYMGDRSLKSMISFAERLNGPDVRSLNGCKGLKELTNQHGLIVLNVVDVNSTKSRETFNSIASKLKSSFWFYETKINTNCKDLSIDIEKEGLYIMKKNHFKAIQFNNRLQDNSDDLEKSILKWLEHNSLPVYGPISSGNIDRVLSLKKPLVVAVLDEYQPARKFSQNSKDFHQLFGDSVRKFIHHYEEDLLFAWTSDLELIKSLVIGNVLTPNIIIINSNYTYNLLITDPDDYPKADNVLPKKLEESNIKYLLESLVQNQLTFHGGNSYFRSLLRQIYGNYSAYMNMYRANPLLSSILVGLPSIIMIFVIYTTCFYQDTQSTDKDSDFEEGDEDDDYEEEEYDSIAEQQQRLLKKRNHKKQD